MNELFVWSEQDNRIGWDEQMIKVRPLWLFSIQSYELLSRLSNRCLIETDFTKRLNRIQYKGIIASFFQLKRLINWQIYFYMSSHFVHIQDELSNSTSMIQASKYYWNLIYREPILPSYLICDLNAIRLKFNLKHLIK